MEMKSHHLLNTNTVVGEANIKYDPIVNRENIINPSVEYQFGTYLKLF